MGLNLPYSKVYFGSSDAAAMDPTPARYYHTRLDTEDNLDERTVKAGIEA